MSSSCLQNIKTPAQIEAENYVTENFVRKKEKWTNKGTDKQHVADSLKHSAILSLPSFVPNFKILGQVDPEKSLKEKKFTDRQTDTQTLLQKRQKPNNPYTLRKPGVLKTNEDNEVYYCK